MKATGKRTVCVCAAAWDDLALRPSEDCKFRVPTEGLSLLGAYEDSDDEEAGDSTANSQRNQSTDIDSTLANFMAVSIIYSEYLNSLLC